MFIKTFLTVKLAGPQKQLLWAACVLGWRFCHCPLGLLTAGAVECGRDLTGGVWPWMHLKLVIGTLCTPGKVGF